MNNKISVLIDLVEKQKLEKMINCVLGPNSN